MRSRNRLLAALGLSLCLGAALGLPATASADHRDGRGWYGERQDRGDHRGRGDWNRYWNQGRRGHGPGYGYGYGWGHAPRPYRYAVHRHGPGCGHGDYGYRGYPFWFRGY